MKPTYTELRSIMRRIANDMGDLLRFAKRMQEQAETVSAMELLRSRIPPLEEGQTLDDEGRVKDAEGNVVADYSEWLYDCNVLLSAFSGVRAAVALLENDTEFLSRPGITGVKHWNFIQQFADLEKRGGL